MIYGVSESRDKQGHRTFELTAPHEVRYRVEFHHGILQENHEHLASYCISNKAVVCIDENLNRLYGRAIRRYFSHYEIDYKLVLLPVGEKRKNMTTVLEICNRALEHEAGRRSIFVAMGGGVTMDEVGLAAQLFRRKVPYVRVPTTLAGLVDAGVGAKVGVNFADHKNMLGAFYPPLAVLNDISFLNTLDSRQLRCGLAEVVKIAIVRNEKLFRMVEESYQSILNREFGEKTQGVIELAAYEMLRELQPNLFEANLKRLSDFGHFFGHVLEPLSDYSLAHGEAVAIDILISTFIAYRRNVCSRETFDKIANLIQRIGLPVSHPVCEPSRIWENLDDVIAHRGGSPNLVMPSRIGKGVFTARLDKSELVEATNYLSTYLNHKPIRKSG